jgi:lipopolysaccharide transport protein LptA
MNEKVPPVFTIPKPIVNQRRCVIPAKIRQALWRTFAGMTIWIPMVFTSINANALETTVKGARMELLEKGEKVVFSGGVVLKRGPDTLKADKMITNKNRDKITAKGNVRLKRQYDDGETWEGYGKKGFYNTKKGEAYLEGGLKRAHVIYTQVLSTSATRVIDMYAKRFDFYQENRKAVGTKKVYGTSVDPETKDLYEFWSDRAVYEDSEGKITLSGDKQPRVRQSQGSEEKTIRGDVIYYYVDTEKFISEGNAQAVFVGEVEQKEKK